MTDMKEKFFTGVVEDNNDPERLGRVRVRVHGIHTDKKERDEEQGIGLPTEDLPWSVPLTPTTNACISGYGAAPAGLLPGTWVFGVSLDHTFQSLLILGSIGTYSATSVDSSKGFFDPDGKYPTEDRRGLPDINTISRNPNAANSNVVAGKPEDLYIKAGPPDMTVCPNVDFEKFTASIIQQESGGRAKIDGPQTKYGRARGLMQLMPSTAQYVARKIGQPYREEMLYDPNYNKMLGQAYLRELLKKYDCNVMLASAAYNGGPGNCDKWIMQYGDPRKGEITDEEFAQKIPFQETKNYVYKVCGRLGGFEAVAVKKGTNNAVA